MVRTIEDPVYDKTKPLPAIKPLYHHQLKNVPGFDHIGLEVRFPPGGAAPPHRHGGASISGVVVSGTSYNKMNNGPTHVFEKGDSWYEMPGCHHKVSMNASDTEELVLIANFVVEAKVIEEGGYEALVLVDEEYRDLEMKPSA